MSTQGQPENPLSLLDRRFSARIRLADLASLPLTAGQRDALFKKGILAACRSDEVDTGRCPLGDHEGDGLLPIQREDDGRYRGACKEHGRVVTLTSQDVEWVRFDPEAWVTAVRGANGLVGDTLVDETGYRLLGVFQSGTKKVAVGVVSSHSPPVAARRGPSLEDVRMSLLADLGDRVTTPASGTGDFTLVNGRELFQDDLISLRTEALLAALGKSKLSLPAGTHAVSYANEGKAVPLTLEEYFAAVSLQNLRRYDLALDLTQTRAWKKGRPVKHMSNKGEKGRLKALSRKGLVLVSYFIRHARRSFNPYRVPPYYDGTVDSRKAESAQVMLLKMRKTLGMDAVLPETGNPSGKRGGGLYAYQPTPGYKVLLLTPPEEE